MNNWQTFLEEHAHSLTEKRKEGWMCLLNHYSCTELWTSFKITISSHWNLKDLKPCTVYKQTNKQSKDLFSGGRILWELSNYFRLGIWGRIFVLRRGRIFQKKELVMVFPAKFEIILADKPQKTPSSQFQAADQPGWVFLLKFGEVFYLLFQFLYVWVPLWYRVCQAGSA